MADLIRNVLKPDGYTVLVVEHAEAAQEVLRTTVPAVFIAEVETEGMSGLDLCLMIKGSERLKGVPVILVTHSSLRVTPAMAANISDSVWTIGELIG
jgi:CheY-like chemotaxis protein